MEKYIRLCYEQHRHSCDRMHVTVLRDFFAHFAAFSLEKRYIANRNAHYFVDSFFCQTKIEVHVWVYSVFGADFF